MGDIETAVRFSKELEGLLESRFSAQGRGLHEKISSVEAGLPPDLVDTLRFIATVRNRAVHEHGFSIARPDEYSQTCSGAITRLKAMKSGMEGPSAHRARLTLSERLHACQWPSALLLALAGSIYGIASVGIGAAVLFGLSGAAGGLMLLSKSGIEYLFQAALMLIGLFAIILILTVVLTLWNVGKLGPQNKATGRADIHRFVQM